MEIVWRFKDDIPEQGGCDDFWDDIQSGSIANNEILEDGLQRKVLEDAISVIESYKAALEEVEIIGDYGEEVEE